MATIMALVIDTRPSRNSTAGNPVREVTLSVASAGWPGEVTLLTEADSALGGQIDNAEYRNTPHIFTLTRGFRLRSATPAGI